MSVLQFPEPERPVEVERPVQPDTNRPGKVVAGLAKAGAVPTRVEVARRLRWAAREGFPQFLVALLKLPYLALQETPHAWIGLCRCAAVWATWQAASEFDTPKGVDSTPALVKARAAKRIGRRRTSFGLVVALGILGWWAAVRAPEYLVLAGVLLLALFDFVGHRERPTEKAAPPPHRAVLKEGVGSARIIDQIRIIAEREGLDFGFQGPVRYDPIRQESRLVVSCLDEITPAHCRAFERGLGAADNAIRVLAPPDGEATLRIMVIKEGDPLALAELPYPPPVEHGVSSIEDGTLVGVGMIGELRLPLAGQHGAHMARSGGGKTSWMIRNTMIGLLRHRDVRPIFIDATNGPERALWHRVLYRSATEPARIEALCDVILAEIDRRADVLTAIAEDDDPSNDWIIEWCRELVDQGQGEYWVIIIDEYPALMAHPDILTKIEAIYRTGRKHGISVAIFYQKTGNDDTGSTVPTSQSNVKVAGPCTPRDAASMFGAEQRDRGWMPHLLRAGTPTDPHDAGKVYLDTPWHNQPDLYRYFRPISPGEVKALCRRVVAEGWRDGWDDEPEIADAVVLDPLLAEVERALAGRKHIPTTELLERLKDADGAVWGELSTIRLADLLRPFGITPGDLRIDGRTVRGYTAAQVREAVARAAHETGD